MTKNSKSLILISSLLTFAFLASYINFSTYKPKTIKQVPVVKGVQTEVLDLTSNLPTPEGSQNISASKSSDSEQTTFHTNKTKLEVQDFYKNIFISNRWQLASQGIYTDFIISRYKKDNQMITVIAYDTTNGFKTLVSLEVAKL